MAKEKDFFTITINDSFCTWEYKFSPDNVEDISIGDIKRVIENHYETKMLGRKLIHSKFEDILKK
jgi:hypothetical protein